MRVLLILAASAVLAAQGDPAQAAYSSWDATQRGVDYKTRNQHLLEVSAEWVAKWPDSKFAWNQRRAAMVASRGVSAELWKQVDENLIRLNPPHTYAYGAAYDWVTAGVNVEAAEKLLQDELAWEETRSKPSAGANATLADLVDEAQNTTRPFILWCSLARAQILLKQYEDARTTIGRVHAWLESDFQRYFDTDPLEAFPDYGAKYFQLSAELATAEGRTADALMFDHEYLANPYYRREYTSPVFAQSARSLWKSIGGTDAGWAVYNTIPPLPPGVPAGRVGMGYQPWVKLDYKLPPMQLADLDSRMWTNRDFEGKTTVVYLWSSRCGPCSPNVGAIQSLSERVKGRRDVQVVTLSVDEERDPLAALMKQKGYTFPVLASKPYVQRVLPQFMLGQLWIVDGSGSVRLQRTTNNFAGAEEALAPELLYKAGQFGK